MIALDYQTRKRLPTMEELPYKDDKPVESEVQDLITHLLKSIIAYIWADRNDWFFGNDIGWYYDPEESAIAPDGFLCLGVERIKDKDLRLSYVTWEENGVIPSFALEVVSKTPGGEYKKKKKKYAQYGVLYYVIYAPRRVRKPKLTIYRLNGQGEYELQNGNPLWMPEIGLGIGTEIGTFEGVTREWLYWYNRFGNRYSTPSEGEREAQLRRQLAEQQREQERQARQLAEQQREQERQARQLAEQQREQERQQAQIERLAREQAERQAQIERQRAEQLAARLQELGIDPDRLN